MSPTGHGSNVLQDQAMLVILNNVSTDIQIFDLNKQTQNIWKTVNKNLLLLAAVEK